MHGLFLLAHPTRIATVEALRDGEISARAIQDRLGIEQAHLPQDLAVLQVLSNVLDVMRRYFQASALTKNFFRLPRSAGPRGSKTT